MRTLKRDVKVERLSGRLVLSLDFPEVFSDRFRRRLSSGFTSRLLVKVEMQGRKKGARVLGLLQYTILYDIWDERFNVRISSAGSQRDLQVRTMEELIARCGSVRRMPLELEPDLDVADHYRTQVRIEVNPASPEERRKVREYLANPDGRSTVGSQRSFFGSFSRIFVRERDIQADAVYTYRSSDVSLPSG
ncbi:MAG: hypothetical protein JXR96_14720 [Deltaproteobacteria bacterium]|nr:hypothetical protein [Deltaproteobacteria bacterium]